MTHEDVGSLFLLLSVKLLIILLRKQWKILIYISKLLPLYRNSGLFLYDLQHKRRLSLLFLFFEFFIPAFLRWFLTGFWVTAIIFKSPELFSVFWPILTVLSFGWSQLLFLFPILPVLFPSFWWLYGEHQLQLVSPSLFIITATTTKKL